MLKKGINLILSGVFIFAISSCAMSQKNTTGPETGKTEQTQKVDTQKKEGPTLNQLVKSIKKYVSEKSLQNGGYFKVYDPKTRRNLMLKLKSVEKKHISTLTNNNYFTCSQYVDTSGTEYDLDIFMHYADGKFTPSKTTIHKVDGVPRYYWYKVDDQWKTKSAGHGTEGPEHIRH